MGSTAALAKGSGVVTWVEVVVGFSFSVAVFAFAFWCFVRHWWSLLLLTLVTIT